MRTRRWLALIAVAILVALGLLWPERSLEGFAAALERTRDAGPAGMALFVLGYVLGTLAMLPGSLLTLAAGFAYGIGTGVALTMVGSLVGATLAFWAGRSVGREWVEELVRRDPRLAAIDRVVERRGFELIFLLRVSPIVPYSLINYALGLTRVPTSGYFWASAIGMLPGTFLYVYLGSAATNLGALLAGRSAFPEAAGRWLDALYWGGLVATVGLVLWVSWLAHGAVRAALSEVPPGEPASRDAG